MLIAIVIKADNRFVISLKQSIIIGEYVWAAWAQKIMELVSHMEKSYSSIWFCV